MPKRSKQYFKDKYGFKSFQLTSGKPNRHLRLTFDMMESKAWSQLSVYAEALYFRFLKKYNGANESDISLTYAEGEQLMSKKTFIQARDQLCECGFIDIIRQGHYIREPNIYALSDRWQRYGKNDFIEKKRRKRGELH